MSDVLLKLVGDLSAEKRERLINLLQPTRDLIAVVGMGCRFPGGANSPEAYWELLQGCRDGIKEVPADRWDVDALYDPTPGAPGKMYTRWGGFLDGVDKFDANFFGISPREALTLDPQQRLLLEVSWEALEDAGLVPEKLKGSPTGVFVGICASDYSWVQFSDETCLDAHTATGNAHSIAANRLSYVYDFQGPSMAVDTACSSSLVTVHLACQSLQRKECDLALAGGSQVILSPLATITFSQALMMAADGRCKTFDSRADGFVRGEGCGIVVLKRLADAVRDGDRILALIRGSAINQDGRTNGLMAPNGIAQQLVLKQALESGGDISPSKVTFIETHGTGTALGDPIEVEALAQVYGAPRADGDVCALGAVKTNIGHLEAAAGIAGLIKVVLSLRHEAIPPNLHFKELNPHISLLGTPFVIPDKLLPWPSGNRRRLAAVSSFGFGGTNAHVILEEAPQSTNGKPIEPDETAGRFWLLPLSARSPGALRSLAEAYRQFLTEDNFDAAADGRDICYSASVRRVHHDHRLAVVGRSREELDVRLGAFLKSEAHPDYSSGHRDAGRRSKLVFVFPGQGAQAVGMGRELIAQEPVFRASIERSNELLQSSTGWSLLNELAADSAHSRLNETLVAQPAIFAFQVALAALWQSWGIVPDAVIGHSLGEVAAAHVAGVLSFEDALQVIFHRGRLMQLATGQGKMAAVDLTLEEAEQLLRPYAGRLSVAAINSPKSVVLAGEKAELEEVLESLRRAKVFHRLLPVDYAFHSHQMEPFHDELVASLKSLTAQPSSVPIYSTVIGQASDGVGFDAAYWGRNIRKPVRFAAAMAGLLKDGFHSFLELSPHPTLSRSISQCFEQNGQPHAIFSSLRQGKGEQLSLLQSLGSLYASGYPIDWSKFHRDRGDFVRLPTYQWQRERFWVDLKPNSARRTSFAQFHNQGHAGHPLLGQRLRSPLREVIFESQVSTASVPFLKDHRIYGRVMMAAAAYLELALAAAHEVFGAGPCVLEGLELREALIIAEGKEKIIQVIVNPERSGHSTFNVLSLDAGEDEDQLSWRLHATGRIIGGKKSPPADLNQHSELAELQSQCTSEFPVESLYELFRQRGFEYGSSFQALRKAYRQETEALGQVVLPETALPEMDAYRLHPVLLDACLQVFGALAERVAHESADIYLPIGMEKFYFYDKVTSALWSHARIRPDQAGNNQTLVGDVSIFNDSGRIVAEAIGLQFKRATREALSRATQNLSEWLHEIDWQPSPLPQATEDSAPSIEKPPGSWLIFADSGGVGQQLSAMLESEHHLPIIVSPGDSYQQLSEHNFQVNPSEPEDFHRLFREIAADTQTQCRAIVHLWSLDDAEEVTLSGLQRTQQLGCASVLHLVQALVKSYPAKPPHLYLVTRGAQPVGDVQPSVAVSQAPLWGLGKVIALEHGDMWGRLIDLDSSGDENEVGMLFTEIDHVEGEDLVAFRGGQRHIARLVRHRNSGTVLTETRLSTDGTYLITGGLGGLGLQVAQWMVERGARHVVLAGRKAPSDIQRELLREMEKDGAKVVPMQGDVAQVEDVSTILTAIDRSMPPLRGVVHAAGVLDDGILINQNWTRFENVMAPKVDGAWNLHSLTKNKPLDFFLLFSSVASLTGSPGQGNYAAANAFLDSLAHYRQARALPGLTINWGPWAGTGMAATSENGEPRRWLEQGITSIDPEQGLSLLGRLLRQDAPQVGVLAINWAKFMQMFEGGREPSLLSEMKKGLDAQTTGVPDQAQLDFRRRLKQAPPDERQELLTSYIRAQVISVLGLDPAYELESERGFFEMGMDSLMALEMKSHLQTTLGFSIPPTLVFEYPTIEALSEYLIKEFFSSGGEISGAAENLDGELTAVGDVSSLLTNTQPAQLTEDEQLLARIDQMSDEEVNALLNNMQADEGLIQEH